MATGDKTFEGLGLPRLGEYQQEQQTAATDIATITGAASQSGDFVVLRDSDEKELFVVEDGGHVKVAARASSGDGVTIVATDGGDQRGLIVSVDDGGTALTAGWCQAILGSTEVYTTFDAAASVFGTSGEVWLNESVTTTGNISGIQGAAVMKTLKTATANVFGVTLGTVFPSGAILASGYYTGGAIIGGDYSGTMTGKVVGIFFQNPTSAGQQFDYAFAFGQNTAYAGCVTVAAVGGSQTHKLKVIAGGTDYFIPMYTA